MKTNRLGIITIFLIIIILACQLLPVVPQAPQYFDSQKSSEGLQLNSNPLQNSIPVFDNSSAKQAFQKVPARKHDGSIYRCEAVSVFQTKMVMPVQIADIRSTIRETISHYFNGSKFKAIHLNV